MPLWVKLMLLGMGLAFLAVGALVGVFGARQAQARLALIERLAPLSAAALDDQPAGADALVAGVVGPRNRAVFRNFVAYTREKLGVTTDSDGRRSESWRPDGGETPRLALEAGGVVMLGGEGYTIERGHEIWYDAATLGFNSQPREGSLRYHGLVAGRPVIALGTVVQGPEGNELAARTLFAGTRAEYLASQRQASAIMPILGAIFGAVGLLLAGIGGLFLLRRPRRA